MVNYPEKLNEVVTELASAEDEQLRMDLLIDYADKFSEVPAEIAARPFSDESKVPFCESEAYVFTRKLEDGSLKFYFAVENPQGISAKSICAIFDKTLSGSMPDEILKIPQDIVFDIFGQGLSMGKNLGLTGILLFMKRDAKKFLNGRSESKVIKQIKTKA